MLKFILNTSATKAKTSTKTTITTLKTKTPITTSNTFTCKLNVILLTIEIIMLNFMLINVATNTVVAAEVSAIAQAPPSPADDIEVFQKNSVIKDDHEDIIQQQQHQHQQQQPSTNKMNRVEEYFIEHRVNEKDAAHSFRLQVNDLLNRKIPAWCMACTSQVIRYCLGNQMLQDHCCCDSRHVKELLPWLPHSCYVGETCQPIIGSCMKYTELKECCCDRLMANQWKDIFSSSTKNTFKFHRKEIFVLELLLYFLLYKFIIR